MMETVNDWLRRRVRITDGPEGNSGEEGVLLAVDDTPYLPAGWMKLDCYGSDDRSYRSVDLCWVEDIETGEPGPAWGTERDIVSPWKHYKNDKNAPQPTKGPRGE